MLKLIYSGKSDIGYKREVNEDYILVHELDDDVTLAIIADGAGSKGTTFQPGSIAGVEIYTIVKRLYEENAKVFLENAELFLKEAMLAAGRILGAFQIANEELYNGYAASVECCLFYHDKLTFAHTGNTRTHLIRRKKDDVAKVKQLTKDQTKGQELVDKGEMKFVEYHLAPERLNITGGLGMISDPAIHTFTMDLRENDFILMTTDGIHYAIRPDIFVEILARSATCEEGVGAMILAAQEEKYADNMSAILAWVVPDATIIKTPEDKQ